MKTPLQDMRFGGESYSFVTNYDTKQQANADVRKRRQRHYKARIYRWKREYNGKILYAIYIRRGKRFKF